VTVQAEVLNILDNLVTTRGMGLIFISHDLRLVARFCDRVLVMYKGKIVEELAAKDLLQAKHPYTQGLLNSLPEHARPGQPLVQIPGQMPSLINLGAECAFLSRCTRSDCLCQASPALKSSGDRRVRCHHPVAGDWS
jgi:oligopeptide/dipeptide ABC transporter ATP-binding protein